jgi:hypothetical protein
MDRRQFLAAAAVSPLAAHLATSAQGLEQSSPNIVPLVVGNTIPDSALGMPCYDAGLTQDQADTKFCHIVSRGIGGGQHLAATKKFWTKSDPWNTSINNLPKYASHGTTVIMTLYPALPGTPAEKTNLKNFLTTVKGFGFNAGNCYIVLWQEPEVASKNISSAEFQMGLQYYGPTVASFVLPLVADIGSGAGTDTITAYGNAAIAAYQAGCGLTGLAQDLYCPAYKGGAGVGLDTLANLADANTLPFGVFEHGCAPSQSGKTQCTTFMNYIKTFMQTRQQAAKPNLPVLYYDGTCSPTGTSDTSPIGQDPSTPSPDFRIPLFQELWDA